MTMMTLVKTWHLYSLKKSRQVMKTGFSWYEKKGSTLDKSALGAFEKDLEQLDQALLQQNRAEADRLARKVEIFYNSHFKKSFLGYGLELFIALVLALAVATVVRQMWFEPYEIPTGSMRPTFKEQDHLTVSKLAFGINTPLETNHLYFDPGLVQRMSVLIFSGKNVPMIDQETTYFGLIPYTKRYIKRLLGKPGDTVYFYGGKLYSIDKDGNDLKELLHNPWMNNLEHIPFLTFEGIVTPQSSQQLVYNQMHQPTGRLSLNSEGELVGEVYNGKHWVKDQPQAQLKAHNDIETYSDFLGMKNYAMARLLTKQQVERYTHLDTSPLEEGVLYLELKHTPSLSYHPKRERGGSIVPYSTLIPLQQHHLDTLFNSMYTARFVVENERAHRYSVEPTSYNSSSPSFPGVPDGTYEFYYGKAKKVNWGGVTTDLPADHPLYSHTPANIQKLFNLGIEMDLAFAPNSKQQRYFPQRYAYFRDGDLYVLGAPLLKKGDPTLNAFLENEKKREASSSYVGFKDYGPPVKADGSYDQEFIRTFGITVPEKHYLVLGDNHAMSSDTRVFGFVPENNLQGAPSLIIWPPGDRFGVPMQKPYPIINVPRIIVWSIALAIAGLWYVYYRWKIRRPVFHKK